MRRFKYDDGTEGVVYETLSELLSLPISDITEYGGDYYITINREPPYYDITYKVNKETEKASYIDSLTYMCDIMDKAKRIDPETLRGAS